MERKHLAFIALVLSIIFGGLFAVIPADSRGVYAAIGGIVVGIAWVSVGVFGREDTDSRTD